MKATSDAIVELGRELRARHYHFTAVTPATHTRLLNRKRQDDSLESIFGWNCWFRREALDDPVFELLVDAGQLEAANGSFKTKLRFASIGDLLFAHSAFPTLERDAVFFGPDTYRFVRAIGAALRDLPSGREPTLFDIGCGSGAGGIFAARALLPPSTRIVLSDVSEKALMFSKANAQLNDLPDADVVLGDVLEGLDGAPDIVISNPPYLLDEKRRLYRDGGGEWGTALSVRIVQQSLRRLASGGRLVLYTGSPVVEGVDRFKSEVTPVLQSQRCRFQYDEVDPDVFGEELDTPAYANADRIAAVVLTVVKE